MSVSRCRHLVWVAIAGLAAATALADEPVGKRSTIETVEVSARRLPVDLQVQQALTPGGVTVIDGEELYRRSVASLADMLRLVPGIWAVSNSGTDGLFLSSRGSNLDATNYDMNGMKLLQDGLPVTTADGNNHNRIIDPLSARYASVARGANALSYGASTLGGAINFVSPTAGEDFDNQLYVNGGSHGLFQSRLSAGAVTDDQRADGLITLETKHWDGYRGHNRQRRQGLYANAGWRLNGAVETRFYATYVDNDEDLPGALTAAEVDDDPNQAAPKAISGNYQKDVETWRLANKTRWQLSGNATLEAGLSWEEQSLFHPIVDKVLVDFDGPGPNPPVEVFSLLIDTDHRDLGAMVRYNLQLGSHDLLAGIHYGDNRVTGGNYRNDGGRRNGLTTRVDNGARSIEAYLLDRWQLNSRWTLVYGAQGVSAERRVRNIAVADGSVRSPDDTYESLNPRAGVIFAVNDRVDLFANVSRLFEAPTNFELEDDVRGSEQTLDPMHGTVVEVGSRGRYGFGNGGEWRWDAALYYARIRDEILSVDDPDAPGTSLATNVDRTVHAGLEFLVDGRLPLDDGGLHSLAPMVNLTVNHFRFDGDEVYGNNRLPAAPGYVVRAELLYRYREGFYAGPILDVVDGRYADFINSHTVDGYTLIGLRAGFDGDGWQLFAELRNLQDRDYIASHAVVNRYSATSAIFNPGEPRSAYVGVRLTF